jgi:hypothetical protein
MAPKSSSSHPEISGKGLDGDDNRSGIPSQVGAGGFVPQGLNIADSHTISGCGAQRNSEADSGF